ncbi:MAG: hypothetical protein ACI8TQ_000139 [Planctomycetota bacterium]|jgi:hypothetical protein
MIASLALFIFFQGEDAESATTLQGPGIELIHSYAFKGTPSGAMVFGHHGRVVLVSEDNPSTAGGQFIIDREKGLLLSEWDKDLYSGPWEPFWLSENHPIELELSFELNVADGTVILTDRLNKHEAAVVDVGPIPIKAVFSPDFSSVVALTTKDEAVSWINTASYKVTSRITEGIGPGAQWFVPCPGGKYALINNFGANTISVLDFESRKIVDQIVVDDGPTRVQIHPDGTEAYIVCKRAKTICVLSLPTAEQPKPEKVVSNKVFMLGTIHGGHETSEVYDLQFLEQFIREVDPNYILAEIPPNRARAAMEGFLREGQVIEERVMRFPEYLQVVYPLTRELDFEIIPTAGWTEPMARFRRNRLKAISEDPERAAEWAEYQAAGKAAEECQAQLGPSDDPYLIHSNAYDDCVELDLSVYDRLFNDELGPGGWTAINKAHYGNIEAALDKHSGEGKRFLITYGAGHKGWFLRELRKRTDIELIDLAPIFKRTEQALGRN